MTKQHYEPAEVQDLLREALDERDTQRDKELVRVEEVEPGVWRSEALRPGRDVDLETAIERARERARREVHERYRQRAERAWSQVFQNHGLPFRPESVDDLEMPPIANGVDNLPGWDVLVAMAGGLRTPYVPIYDHRAHFHPETRKRRREALKRGEERGPNQAVEQARNILVMLERLELFIDLWRPRCQELVDWETKDLKRATPLPPSVKEAFDLATAQRQKWAEAQMPPLEPAPHEGMAQRVIGGETKQPIRPIETRLNEDGAIELTQAGTKPKVDPDKWMADV